MQIKDRIVEMIRSGTLEVGDKLPGTRNLAMQLGVSRKTVLQAYLELAADSWVESHPGSCTYVLDRSKLVAVPMPNAPVMEVVPAPGEPADSVQMDWGPYQLDGRFFGMPRHSEKWTGKEEWINFSRAIPDVRLIPFDRIKKVSSQMLWDPKSYFFDYGHPQGYQPLVNYLETSLAKDGLPISEGRNDVVISSGFQSALNLLLTIMLEPGDKVVVENPTFTSILNMLTARKIPHIGVPMEHDGMDMDFLERVIAKDKPKLIITIPTLHNPTGYTMSLEKRERLILLAQKYNIPIIEDYWSIMLDYEGMRFPSLKILDTGNHVIQICSMSKSFLPGTRVAWVVLPGKISVSFSKAKRAMDRTDSYFLQTMVFEFIKKGYMDLHCRKVDRIYRGRRDLMAELMKQHFPSEASWKHPAGGFTYWVTMPPRCNSQDLLKRALKVGIEFAPGSFFYVDRRDSSSFRLAFSTLTQPQLRQGVKRLGKVIVEMVREDQASRLGRSAL